MIFFFLGIENDFTIRIQQVHAKANQQNKGDQEKAAELPVIKKEDEQEHVIRGRSGLCYEVRKAGRTIF